MTKIVFNPFTSNLDITDVPNFLPAKSHEIWISVNGSDINGDGSYDNPYYTVNKGLLVAAAANPTSANPYTVKLMAGRYDYETFDLRIPPWTWVVGSNTYQTGYIKINGGAGNIGPTSGWSSGGVRGGLSNVYLGGGTSLSWDLASVGGAGSPSGILQLFNVFITGITLINGRATGIDFSEIYNLYCFGAATIDSQSFFCNTATFNSGLNVTANSANADMQLINSQVTGNTSISTSGGRTNSVMLYRVNTSGVLSATGPGVTVQADSLSTPSSSNLSITGGAALTRTSDVTGLAFTPTVPANWPTVPTTTQQALDNLAATSVTNSNSIINALIFG